MPHLDFETEGSGNESETKCRGGYRGGAKGARAPVRF